MRTGMTAGSAQAAVIGAADAAATEMHTLLASLVQTPSISGTDAENAIQAELAALLSGLGLDIDHWELPLQALRASPEFPGMEAERSGAFGLVGRLPGRGAGSTLMLNAHVDVVPPGDRASWRSGHPFSGHVHDGALYGRGACDMKGGLVAAIWAVTALRRSGVQLAGDVFLACVQGEEDGGLGTFGLLQRGWRADACIIPEPTSLDLVPASAGSLTFRLRVPGRAVHASQRKHGVSAVEKFWPMWQALGGLERRRNRQPHPLMARWDPPYPISIGIVRAGNWASSVPEGLIAEGRIGVALGEPVHAAKKALQDTVAAACQRDPWLRRNPATVEWWGGQFAPGLLPENSDLTRQVSAAHEAAGGGPQRTWGSPWGSDLRLMTGLGAVPTLHYGPGDSRLAHGPDESVPLAEVRTAAKTLALLALELCR